MMSTQRTEALAKLQQMFEDNSTRTLETEFESAAKHVPAYLKIVKSHIEQLSNVLSLESHGNKTLDDIELSTTVTQLIKMFKILKEGDIQTLENLAKISKNWKHETTTTTNINETSTTMAQS